MRAVVLGLGAVGARAARQLHASNDVDEVVLCDVDEARASRVQASLGDRSRAERWAPSLLDGLDVAVLAVPSPHVPLAALVLEHDTHVVSAASAADDIRSLLELDIEARRQLRSVVVGAGFSPGLSCLLVRHAAAGLSSVDEVHVAKLGTGGPACARDHHLALTGQASDWRDGGWVARRGGSGRQLCWFPDPIGGRDCYRAALAEPFVLQRAFPSAMRITARVAASRRDRFTARLPMLRRPHPEGMIGALRVEVRGERGAARDVQVLGALDRPAAASGTVAATAARWATAGRLLRPGAGGLGELVGETAAFLHELAERGVRAAVFEGTSRHQ